MLYFGSFNPIHRGHIALAEYVVERGLCDELVMVVSPQNPLKQVAGLAPELERFTMAELACGESKYPDQIKPSLIEFMLPRPSYTINTLRHLSGEYGSQMSFSILMGGDLVEQLEKWRDYQEILEQYPIYIYPRRDERVEKHLDRVTLLDSAPFFDVSSTEIRRSLMFGESVDDMISKSVLSHIKQSGLWSEPVTAEDYLARGEWHYQHERWGDALNDFGRVLKLDPDNQKAQNMRMLARQILDFRYKDIYNP